jgi:outer membrane protein TolC
LHYGVGVLALALTFWVPCAQAQERPLGATLAGLLDYAREHNPELRARKFEAEAAQERVEPAAALPDPKIQVELLDFTNAMTPSQAPSLRPGDVGTTRYRALQSLPFPGKRGLRGEIAATQAAQSDAMYGATVVNVERQIKAAYARYFQAVGQARILRETLSLVEAVERLVVTRYRVGLVPQQDALQAQSEITSLKIDLVESERSRRDATVKLNALLPREANAPLAEPLRLASGQRDRELRELFTLAKERSPELAQERHALTAAEKGRTLTYLERFPDFTLALTDNRTRPEVGPRTWDFMVEINIPLQQSSRRAQEREAERRLDAARERVAAAEANLNGRLGETLAALEASRDKSRLLRETLLPQARATLDAAQAAYETGRVNFNTLIDAARQTLRVRFSLLDAEVDTSIRCAELEQLVGEPL